MFGARIYDLQVRQGAGGRKPLDLVDPLSDGVTAREHIVKAAGRLGARGAIPRVPNTSMPAAFDPTVPPYKQDPLTTFLLPAGAVDPEAMPGAEPWAFDSAGDEHAFLKVEYGYVGAYENARDTATTIPIQARAATSVFRALFLLPTAGTHGRLCVETNGRVSPLVPILGLLAWQDYGAAVAGLPQGQSEPWVRYLVEQMADLARLRRLAQEMEQVEVELSRKQPKRAGGSVGRSITLTVTLSEQQRRKEAMTKLLGWVDGGEPGEYVHVLEKIAGYNPDELEAAGLTFNAGTLEVTDKHGQRKKLDPENIRARFTYPLSEIQLDDTAWLDRVKAIVTGDLLAGSEVVW